MLSLSIEKESGVRIQEAHGVRIFEVIWPVDVAITMPKALGLRPDDANTQWTNDY